MSQTYTRASERDLRSRLQTGHLLLALTSIVAMLVIGMASSGRLRTLEAPASVIDLNTVSAASELEPLFEALDTNPLERRSAAQGLFDFILTKRNAGESLP